MYHINCFEANLHVDVAVWQYIVLLFIIINIIIFRCTV